MSLLANVLMITGGAVSLAGAAVVVTAGRKRPEPQFGSLPPLPERQPLAQAAPSVAPAPVPAPEFRPIPEAIVATPPTPVAVEPPSPAPEPVAAVEPAFPEPVASEPVPVEAAAPAAPESTDRDPGRAPIIPPLHVPPMAAAAEAAAAAEPALPEEPSPPEPPAAVLPDPVPEPAPPPEPISTAAESPEPSPAFEPVVEPAQAIAPSPVAPPPLSPPAPAVEPAPVTPEPDPEVLPALAAGGSTRELLAAALGPLGVAPDQAGYMFDQAEGVIHEFEDLPPDAAVAAACLNIIEFEDPTLYEQDAARAQVTQFLTAVLGPTVKVAWPAPGDDSAPHEVVSGGAGAVTQMVTPGFDYTDATGAKRTVRALVRTDG